MKLKNHNLACEKGQIENYGCESTP